jgi:hypothetical protein
VGVASKTVRSVARRYEEEGLESALFEKPRPGQRRVLDAGQSQGIIALVCGPPPGRPGAVECAAPRPGSREAKVGTAGGPGNDPHPAAES